MATLADYRHSHPDTLICLVEGTWYAWEPEAGDPLSGELSHGRTEDELLGKLQP